MKKITNKVFLLGIIISIFLAAISIPSFAKTETKTIVLKKSDDKYLIYFDEICNNAFKFAISNDQNTKQEDLKFIASAKDNNTENSLNIAYLDETNYSSNNDEIYIWVKDNLDNLAINGEKIDLKNVIDDEILNFINTTTIVNKETDRIKVDTTQAHVTNAVVDGVDTTIKTGKIVIDENESSTYYYKLIAVDEKNLDAKELYDLVDKINNYSGNTYGKLKLATQFYELYNKQMPEKSEWNIVQNSTILQPEDSKTGDKYIAYVKEINKNQKEVIDIKLLECVREEAQGKNQKEETVTEDVVQTVKLPVTYDSIILIIIMIALIMGMVIVTLLKMKHTPKHTQKRGK